MSTPFLVVKICCMFIGFMAIGCLVKLASDWKLNRRICHSTFPGVIERLSTHAPYATPSHLIDPPHLKGCKAEQIWFMSRHGTRNPSDKEITQMKTLLPKIQEEIVAANPKEICRQTFADIAAWKVDPGLNESFEKFLTPQGRRELGGLGFRYKKRFPDLFDHKYDNSTYKFKFTKTERAEASARAFATSLFGEDGEKDVLYPEAVEADPVLRANVFYKACKRWKQEVDTNPDAQKERKSFEDSKHYKQLSRSIQRRLGLKRNLTLDEIEVMYNACAYESAWNFNTKKLSPWCGVFDERDLKVMEYAEDLQYYWGHGYGFQVNYEQACSPVKNFVDAFQARIDDPESAPNVIAYFSHSGAQLKFLSRLGLFKDDQILKSDNYLTQGDRKWRSSHMDKFATNIAFLLHKCDEDYVISAFFQEVPIKLPQCDDWYCKFSDYKSKMSDIVDNCDVDSLCQI